MQRSTARSHVEPKKTEDMKTESRGFIEFSHVLRYEPPRGKTNNVVSEQVRHKPVCTSTEKS